MPKAELVLHEKVRTADGIVVEFKVWRITRSADYPEPVGRITPRTVT